MKLSRNFSVLVSVSIAIVLQSLADDSLLTSKSFADIQKAKANSECVADAIDNPCHAKRKEAICPTGASYYCGAEDGVNYTAKSCTAVSGSDFSCFPETKEPCGVTRRCLDDADVIEDQKPVPCNSTYNKCVQFSPPNL